MLPVITRHRKIFFDAVSRQGLASARNSAQARHLLSVRAMAPNRPVNRPARRPEPPPDDRQIFFCHGAIFELVSERAIGAAIFGNDHHAGSVFFEPVDDARPTLTAD